MTLQRQIDQLVTHRASEWLEILKAGRGHEHEAFVKWITESPRHVTEFLSLVALDQELRDLDLKGCFDLAALLRKTSRVTQHRVVSPRAPAKSNTHRLWSWASAAAMAILVLGLGIWIVLSPSEATKAQRIATAVGEQRFVELPDGSVIHVNALSSVRIHVSDTARDVQLLRGEALFKVARDVERPFRVHTRDAVVQALGTQFNVYAQERGTAVSVLEGKVQVSIEASLAQRALSARRINSSNDPAQPATLGAGQAVQVNSAGKIEHKPYTDVLRATAWRQRRVVFDKTPLEDVIQEFNRYNKSVRLRLEGVQAGSHHYSGNFDADDPDSLAAFLSSEQDLAVERRRDEIVIRARP